MKQTVISISACVLFSLLLAGCGHSDSSAPVVRNAPVVSLAANKTIVESTGSLAMTLTLERGESIIISFSSTYGSATADDFEALNGSIELTTAVPSATIILSLKDDTISEDSESFSVTWASGNSKASIPETTLFTILDDDSIIPLPESGAWTATGLFHPASDCIQCHKASNEGEDPAILRAGENIPDPNGVDISPYADLNHSLMAHAFNDPWYMAKVASEAAQHPELAGFIEDKCLTCHAPMSRTQAHIDGRLATVDDSCTYHEGCLRLATAIADPMSREAISCTLCHRIDERVMTEDRHSGNYPLNSDLPTPVLFGPFTSPVTMPMMNQLAKTPAYGVQMNKSEHCASCHDLFTPVVDANTNLPNGNVFSEQTPYREWLNSDYAPGEKQAAACQDCHMPAIAAYKTRIALRGNGTVNAAWPEREPYARHTFVGGNTHILKILKAFRQESGILGTTTEAGFDNKIAENRELIASSAELLIDNTSINSDTLFANITVTNLSGHKLPTGYPSRRMWVAVEVLDHQGQAVFSSGMPDEKGYIALDSILVSGTCTQLSAPLLPCFVPHRNNITAASEVPIYESILGDTENGITHTLLHASHYLKDNRLPPAGFSMTDLRFDPATAVIGVSGDDDFNAAASGSDTVHYTINLAGSTGPWVLSAKLYLQTIRPSFIASLRSDTDAGRNFHIMTNTVPPVPELMAEKAVTISP